VINPDFKSEAFTFSPYVIGVALALSTIKYGVLGPIEFLPKQGVSPTMVEHGDTAFYRVTWNVGNCVLFVLV